MITVEEAIGKVLAETRPLGAEQVMLDEAAGRALAEAIVATRTLPPWDNSAMDGYAVRAADVALGRPLRVTGTHGAGHAPGPLAPGSAARIMTGAPVPPGADAIVMREDSDETGEGDAAEVRFRSVPGPGQHVRRAGEDVTPGSLLLDVGAPIGPGEIGLLAAQGRTVVQVRRRPRVAIVSTGDELVEPDRAPGPGQIVGTNGWALAAQCRAAGALPWLLPIARDDRAVIRAALAEALTADVVLSSGGVSVGEFDFVKEALGSLGVEQSFWKVRMKPGKPLAFGTQAGRPVFGLPGNPASSMVAFELFVRPALRRMQGFADVERPRARAILDEPLGAGGGRRHYLRARVRREGGLLYARPNARQGSGMLRSMVGVNALLEVPEDAGPLAAGAEVTALLLEQV